MQFKNTLIRGRLIKRYKRFLCDVSLEDGHQVTAHCANSGSLLGVKESGMIVWVSPAPPTSKGTLKYRWELVEADGGLVGINTSYPNALVEEALKNKKIPELAMYNSFRREVKYGINSRIDLLLEEKRFPPCYVEVKSVHLKRSATLAEFPDSVTARGTKHLEELIRVKQEGGRAVMIYVVQRMDCDSFTLASDIDPTYANAAIKAKKVGVEFFCYSCHITLTDIMLNQPLKIIGL